MRRTFLPILIVLFSLLASPAWAQNNAGNVYDPAALAARFLGVSGPPALPELTPVYQPGERETFWVAKAGSDEPVEISAVLAARAGSIYLWVESGITFNGLALQNRANTLDSFYRLLRLRGTYSETVVIPGIGEANSPTGELPVPDVDNDPHVFVIYLTNGLDEEGAVYIPMHSLPPEYAPSGVTNAHETILVNTSALAGVPLEDGIYATLIVRGLYALVMSVNNPGQATWLRDALIDSLLRAAFQQALPANQVEAYMNNPNLSLIDPGNAQTRLAVAGMQGMFINYLNQRYGQPLYMPLFLQPGIGLSAVEAVLRSAAITDVTTGEAVTARALFRDFTLANVANSAIGDGRYQHRLTELEQGQASLVEVIDALGTEIPTGVAQFGTRYFAYTAQADETVVIQFEGAPVSPRLSMTADHAPTDRFYWSGGEPGSHRTLTRAVDLRGVTEAELTFEAWSDLAPFWNYGYVTVSTDGGTTWTILPLENAPADPYGNAYGSGLTGRSNPEPPRPFPLLGIVFSNDNLTITEVSAGGPAEAAGLRAGDQVVGVDGERWVGTPNILGALANYRPGDTIRLLIQRGGEERTIPVVLAAHPTRIVVPQPLWQQHTVDLSRFAGEEILIGFEIVSLPGRDDQGLAIDNLSIEAIGWSDSGDTAQGWTLNGWQAVDNTVAQTYLLTALQTGTQTKPARVIPLISGDQGAISGQWQFTLEAGEGLLVAVSGASDQTRQSASFNLRFLGSDGSQTS